MKVCELNEKLDLTSHVLTKPDKDISGVYAGDLLSWVMGHADEGNILITIMSNINVLAVASLLDLSCVILSEGVKPDEEFINLAKEKQINIFSSTLDTYSVCTKLYEILK